jgi:hypothetical protein
MNINKLIQLIEQITVNAELLTPEQRGRALQLRVSLQTKEIPDYYSRLQQMEAEGKAASAGDISDALMSVIDTVKGLGAGASGADMLKAILEGVKGQCADKQGLLKIVGEAFSQP